MVWYNTAVMGIEKLLKLVVGCSFAGAAVCVYADANTCWRVAALDDSLWSKSEWICAADAPEADDAVKESLRAADGTSWFVREVVNEGEVVSASTKTNLEMRVAAEHGACEGKMKLASRAKELGLDAIHDTVHEMARDEARHGCGFKGLLERYFK